MYSKTKIQNLVLASVFAALILAMTFIPYTGYIMYAPPPASVEVTTLHIVTILGASLLGWKYGAVLGGVWGLACILRAATNSMWADFMNPMISLLPRIAVGLVVGLLFMALKKTRLPKAISVGIVAAVGTVTNTVLVLTMYNFFGGGITQGVFDLLGSIFSTLIAVNGTIELVAAIVLVPLLYNAVTKATKKS